MKREGERLNDAEMLDRRQGEVEAAREGSDSEDGGRECY
jgi:hypothetical protein